MLPSDELDFIRCKVGKNWDALRGKTIFLTGGTGFFGIWLLESFAHANDTHSLGARIIVLTRDPAAFSRRCPHLASRPDIHLHQGDARDFTFPAGTFSHIIHAATDTTARVSPENASAAFLAILDGTRHVLDFSANSGVERLLYVSSGAVYGPQPPDLPAIPESYTGAPAPFHPASYYGEAKRACEFLCAAHADAHGYSMNSARCFAFVGPHLPLDGPYAIGNFIRDALAGTPPRVTGAGNAMRSYLYAADLTVWLWRILLAGHGGRAYNVGSDHPISISDLAVKVAEAGNTALPPSPIAATPASRYIPDTTLARNELGLLAWTPLPEAIRKTLAWHRLNTPSPPSE